MDYADDRILVTGGGSGIGRATARAFAERGGTVLATDVDVAAAEETADRLADSAGTVIPKKLDVTDRTDFDDAIRYLERERGPITTLVNNAGIRNRRPFLEASTDELREAIEVNVLGTWNGCKAAIPAMLDAGGGAVVNVASIAAFLGWDTNAIYCLTKGAVLNFTRALAKEFSGHGIRVNAVCPGMTETEHVEEYFESEADERHDLPDGMEMRDVMRNMYPMGRFADPDEIAETIAYLASDDASFVTGHGLVVDGGYSIW